MSNHYHLLIKTPRANLADGMKRLNGLYTQRFNKRHKRIGHLFQGRYKAFVIEKESYFLEVCRYIVLNPLQAGELADYLDLHYSTISKIVKNNSRFKN